MLRTFLLYMLYRVRSNIFKTLDNKILALIPHYLFTTEFINELEKVSAQYQ